LPDINVDENCDAVVVDAPKQVFSIVKRIRWDAVGNLIQQRKRQKVGEMDNPAGDPMSIDVDVESKMPCVHQIICNDDVSETEMEVRNDDVGLHNRIFEKLLPLHKWWNSATPDSVRSIMEEDTARKLKSLTKKEVMVFVQESEEHQVMTGIIIPKSWTKGKMSNALSRVLGDQSQVYSQRIPKTTAKAKSPIAMESLQKAAFAVISSFPKDALNAIYAVCKFDREEDLWSQRCPFGPSMTIEGFEGTREWFSFPETHVGMEKPVVKTLDGHHLLVNLRAKICKDGVRGIKKEAFSCIINHIDCLD
jgi:hypothetical protein